MDIMIDFDEQYHAYAVNGDIADISVTELLHKHKLAPSYKGVPSAVLQKAAQRGTEIHKDIELYVNNGQPPKTEQGQLFRAYFDKNIENGMSERPVCLKFGEKMLCGTADLICRFKDGTFAILDHKCTATLDKTYVAWQVSLLDYMFKKNKDNTINGTQIKWEGADKVFVNHFNKEGGMIIQELDRIPDKEIERLLLAESHNEIYEPKELILDSLDENELIACENKAYELEMAYKQAKEKQDEWRKALLEAMERQGIKKWTSRDGKLTATLVAETVSVGLDTAKIKKEFPQVCISCKKETIKKAYVRVTRHEEKEDEI